MTEGSLFYGYRLIDSRSVDQLKREKKISSYDIVDSDSFITHKLGSILHDNPEYYKNIKRIRNSKIAKKLGLNNTPYFLEINEQLISQYKMSSGECLLISLLHFVYNSIVRRSIPKTERIMLIIDEIELALHPIAIKNLMTFLKVLCSEHENLTVIVTSHSPEVIKSINPNNMFYIDRQFNEDNSFHVETPIYPSYAIRDLYSHDGYDCLLLVEDELAKKVVNKVIKDKDLQISKLIHVLPVGGWRNVLSLQKDILENNVLGIGKTVISILDGDIALDAQKEFGNLRKLFLPIMSVDKYLYDILIKNMNRVLYKKINDLFFQVESLLFLIRKYEENEHLMEDQLGKKYSPDVDGKRFYRMFLNDLQSRKLTEESFINVLCDIIQGEVDLSKFSNSLEKNLQK